MTDLYLAERELFLWTVAVYVTNFMCALPSVTRIEANESAGKQNFHRKIARKLLLQTVVPVALN